MVSTLICLALVQAKPLPNEVIKQLREAKPGQTIVIPPGEYRGGVSLQNIRGASRQPIVIRGQDPKNPPVFRGGSYGFHIAGAQHLVIQDIVIEDVSQNGLNIDDGGNPSQPSTGIFINQVKISRLPKGNHDGIKLSGIKDFRVENCQIEEWGGSAIDMVGCHNGNIMNCQFRNGGDNAVQAKGGTSQVAVQKSHFENFGQRGVNIGGSTGREFFRPPLSTIAEGQRFEASNITVINCTFVGGVSPIAFVGSLKSNVRFNTIYHPSRWAIRILQETRGEDFLPCKEGTFNKNIVIYRSDQWASGGVNIGDRTLPTTFNFDDNVWFCSDRPNHQVVTLPGSPKGNMFATDPKLLDPAKGKFEPAPGSEIGRLYGALGKSS